jgi:HSP20 family protein
MVTRWDPWTPMLSLHDAMNRLFNESFIYPTPSSTWTGFGTWANATFPYDLYETADDLVIRAAIPGVDPHNLDVTVEQGILSLHGYRSFYSGEEENQYRWHTRGLSEGEFRMSFALPTAVDVSGAEASYEAGLLTIRLPKSEEVKPKRITIRGAEAQTPLPAGSV